VVSNPTALIFFGVVDSRESALIRSTTGGIQPSSFHGPWPKTFRAQIAPKKVRGQHYDIVVTGVE